MGLPDASSVRTHVLARTRAHVGVGSSGMLRELAVNHGLIHMYVTALTGDSLLSAYPICRLELEPGRRSSHVVFTAWRNPDLSGRFSTY